MAIFSAIAAGIGAAASAVGTAVGSIGLGGLIGAASAVTGVIGQMRAAKGQREAAKGAQRAEALRARQMNLEAQRERRQTIRQSIIARAQALNAGTQQGAQDSSGLLGGVQNVGSQAAGNIVATNMNEGIGQGMFNANAQIARGQTMASQGQAIAGFGNFLTQSRDSIFRVTGIGGPTTARA